MITFVWLKPREFGFLWDKRLRFLYIGCYFFALRIDLGRTYRLRLLEKVIQEKKNIFNRLCEVCKKPVIVLSKDHIVRFHKQCRKLRSRKK